LVGAADFWARAREDIARASRRVLVQAMSFEGDSAGLDVARALSASKAADRRVLVEESMEDVKKEIVELLDRLAENRGGFSYTIQDLFEVMPTMTDRDGPVARTTAAAIRHVIGRDPEFICSPGTYDQKHIDRVGKLKDCIAYGPGILDLAHKPDEYVLIDDMVASAQVMALAAWSLLHKAY